MFRTAVCSLSILIYFNINLVFGQFEREEYMFVASSFNMDKRHVSDLHITLNQQRDTLDVSMYFLENWISVDSLESRFILNRNARDSVYTCNGLTFLVYVYETSAGDKLFLERPKRFVYYDNYGQEKSSWDLRYAAVSLVGVRKKYNTLFDCYHNK